MIVYCQATRHEFELAVSWAAEEGWNPGLTDADCFWQTDPEGFVCAEENGEVVATGSVVSYSGAFGFMGFFIVRPDRRGVGVGRDFWVWRRDRLRSGAAIGMDGVFDMQPFYGRGGFTFSHRSLRMAGLAHAYPSSPAVVDLNTVWFSELAAFDRQHFDFDRTTFLRSWIQPAGGRALGLLADGRLTGFGVIRPCREGFKIGPLFAQNYSAADTLFQHLASHAVGETVLLDVPENNAAALSSLPNTA
ncbi:MAG: GNAT family N-acetyltransferase [Candidatus Synoicihabitans palmerolidicus]|nr:GNAT family N-acetyltransferase [Candidatus Synoicihabitans palmerolidicus]